MNHNVGAISLIGGREENQDCYKYAETHLGLLVVVCDGMGGAAGGKEAAELAVDRIFTDFTHSAVKQPDQAISGAILKANLAIFKESAKNPWLSGMGTTVTALLLGEDKAFCFHVGDSRIYHLREEKILYRTFDHSRVFEMVHLGLISEEEARISPMSNVITRVLGTDPSVEVTVSPALSCSKGDRFLLCTDGIWGALPEPELIKLTALRKPVDEVVLNLSTYISKLGKNTGIKHDNMTAVLIEV